MGVAQARGVGRVSAEIGREIKRRETNRLGRTGEERKKKARKERVVKDPLRKGTSAPCAVCGELGN